MTEQQRRPHLCKKMGFYVIINPWKKKEKKKEKKKKKKKKKSMEVVN